MVPLIVLGLIIQNPGANGYELLSLMESKHYKYVVNVTKGSFYYNLQQLEDKGHIVQVDKSANARESRYYEVTPSGKQLFYELMAQQGEKSEYVNLSFYSTMLFSKAYPKSDMQALINSQMEQTNFKIVQLTLALQSDHPFEVPFRKMLENSLAHHRVNLEWFQSLIEDLESLYV